MNISELVFTSLGPFLYNLLFLVLWIDYHYKGAQIQTRKYFEKYLREELLFYLMTGLLILLFLFLLFGYAFANTKIQGSGIV
ncbi:hypothetical protein CEE45_04255 [Candidatus Heimdallarchaeota archaeon B3_Heim]|nr:MAG: hypothetical protein CEE45_04255 [Candidatus Heimdallarchaeota archaeon B3_Heim]